IVMASAFLVGFVCLLVVVLGGGMFGGGGMGGGGGGFFNVADEVQPSDGQVPSGTELRDTPEPANAQNTLPVTDWQARFREKTLDTDWVREQARHLMSQGQADQVVVLIQAALQHGQSQPWMYESLGIALELTGQPKSEIERAIMSACDFCSSPDELLLIARYLSHAGLDRRAVSVYRQVAKLSPLHCDAYALGLRAAQRAEDVAGIRWATVGVLKHDWPQAQQKLPTIAMRVAKATLDQLGAVEDQVQYQDFRHQLDQAMIRDVVVKVSWSGDADVDLIVEEPGGTICSLHTPRTRGGGVCLGDSYTDYEKQEAAGLSEEYRCAEGFAGTYRVRIRKVWGELVAGKVAVDVTKNYGTKNERHQRQHIVVSDDSDALVLFDVGQSRREKPLAQEQLAVAVGRQEAISQAVLAQQFDGFSDPSIAPRRGATNNDLRRRLALAGQGGAVGFRPIIQLLQDGTSMTATAVVSADRRYVRITSAPMFSGIGAVSTFTFAGAGGGMGGMGGGGMGGGGMGGGGMGGGGGGFGG
ncbi:MAG: hypothetical protein MK171_03995, partial [Pirellulales bacterium]|nr:hypothetical protein [Pirellulales bacterium]